MIMSGLSLVVIASMGLGILTSAGAPTIYCPLPTLTILPMFILSRWGLGTAAVLVPVVLYFAWFPGLLMRGYSRLPKRIVWLIAALSVLTVVDFSIEWKDGLEYQGSNYTMIVGIINVIWLGVLWWVAIRAWRRPSFKAILLAHWFLFAWLSWYAFPYLGELP